MSSRSLTGNEELYEALQKIVVVVKNSENRQLESIMVTKPVDLVIFEVSKEVPAQVDLIKHLKKRSPNTIIIVVDGDEDRGVIPKAFSYGTKDAFRRPYNRTLIVERVQTLLSRMS